MNKLVRTAWALGSIAVLGGCAMIPVAMRPARSQKIRPPAAEKVQVVFMRTSNVSGGISADLFEVINGELKFIGVLDTGTRIVYDTTPGKKVFMAYGHAAISCWPTTSPRAGPTIRSSDPTGAVAG
jgi:hypothetical protein